MSTVFIALQCFQCSTMQVKQRKKSSNKWNCVICNETQSVRKVFSQAYMAKDVWKFVQSFNMSRQFVEQQQELLEETLDEEQVESQTNKKRTDWSDYIEPDINDAGIDDDEGELCEPNVVTELPKPLFKKPKLRANYSAAGLDCEDDETLRRPVFGKRSVNKKINNPDKEPRPVKENSKSYTNKEIGASSTWREYYETEHHDSADYSPAYKRSSSVMTQISKPISKWKACADDGDNVDHGLKYNGLSSVMMKLKKPVSKWNDFIDDAEGLQLESRCQETNHAAFETKFENRTIKKRTNWSEYIEPDINEIGIGDDEVELCEPNVVTELPKPLFKKPKLRANYSAVGLAREDDEELTRPVFGKKIVNRKINNQDKEPRTSVKENSNRILLNHDYTDEEIGASSSSIMTIPKGLSSVMKKLKRPVSKWDGFIDDADDLQLESRCQENDHAALEMKVSDEIVEDDVHPDFLLSFMVLIHLVVLSDNPVFFEYILEIES